MTEDRTAARRFWIMQACRLAALCAVLAGAYALAERGWNRPDIGTPLLLLGAFSFFAVPLLLSRRWKSR